MGGKGGGGTTVQSSNSPPPQVLNAYQNVVSQAQNVAQTPLSQYTGPMVAGFTPAQLQSFQTVNNAQGAADPYINAAAQYAGSSATPITPTQFSSDQVQQYENPYTQDVVNATQAQFNNQNQQAQEQLVGNTVSQGAFGGDRAAIAQSELANQQQLAQAPTIAGLQQQNYSQALGEFNTEQSTGVGAQEATGWLGSNAGYALGNLGNEAESTALQGASSQLQTGALQQQLAQEELNIPYEEFQQQQGYPYQQENFLAGITEGVGGLEGGDSSTTSPGASTGSEVAGLGVAGLGALGASGAFGSSGYLTGADGLFSNRGGRVPRAPGGLVPGFGDSDANEVNQLLSLTGESTIPELNGGGDGGSGGSMSPYPRGLTGTTTTNTPDSSGGGWGGAATGAGEGALIGTEILPGWGTAIGAGVGALYGGLSNRGGRVPRADGGASSLPGVPDVSLSYIPQAVTSSGHSNTMPTAPKPVTNQTTSQSSNPLSELQQGLNFGKLFKGSPSSSTPTNVPGVGANADPVPYTAADLDSASSFDAATLGSSAADAAALAGSAGAAADAGALSDIGDLAFLANRGGRIGRAPGGATVSANSSNSPLISGFTSAPGRDGIYIPVLGGGASTSSGQSVEGSGAAMYGSGLSPVPGMSPAGGNMPPPGSGGGMSGWSGSPSGSGSPQNTGMQQGSWRPPPGGMQGQGMQGQGGQTAGLAPANNPSASNFAIPTASIGTNTAGTPAPAGQLDINPTYNWSPPNPNSLSSAIYLPSVPPPAPPAAPPAAAQNGQAGQGTGNGDSHDNGGGNGNGAGGVGQGGNSAGNDGSDGASDGGTGGNGGDGNANRGGVVQWRRHRDMGGANAAATASAGAMSSGQPIGGGNPLYQQQYSQYAQLPIEKLQELSQRLPPTSPQGAVIQRALQAKKMNPMPPQQQQSGFGQAPTPYGTLGGTNTQSTSQPAMARGGFLGYDGGGSVPIDPRLQRIAGLQSDRGASDRGEKAAGSAATPFTGMLRQPPQRPGFDDGGAPADPSPNTTPTTQVQSLSGMTDQDLIAAQGSSLFSPSLVQNEMDARGIRSGFGNMMHNVGTGISNFMHGAHDTIGQASSEQQAAEALPAEQMAAAPGQTADWFTKPVPRPTAPLRVDDRHDQVEGGDPSTAGVAPPAGLQPAGPPPSGGTPGFGSARTKDDTFTPPPASQDKLVPAMWTNPDTGDVVPSPQSKPPVPPRDVAPPPPQRPAPMPQQKAAPVPPSGGTVGGTSDKTTSAPAPDQKVSGLQRAQPAAPSSDANNWSQSPWLALVNAGARMAAGNSPHALQNVGAGIEAGTKTLTEQAQFAQTQKFKQAEVDARSRGYDIEAKRLDADLQNHKDSLAEEHDWHGKQAEHEAAATAVAQSRANIADAREADYQQRILDQGNRPQYLGPSTDPDNPGSVLLGKRKDGTYGPYIDSIKVGAKQGAEGSTAQIRNANWLLENKIAPDKDTAWAMSKAGVNDKASADRYVGQIQTEVQHLRTAPENTGKSEEELRQMAQQNMQAYAAGRPAQPGAAKPSAAAAPQYTTQNPWTAPKGADEPTIRKDFEALHKGAVYINPSDGLTYTKN